MQRHVIPLVGGLLCLASAEAATRRDAQAPPPQLAQSYYYVYCANERIEVESRDPEQMRIARGSNVCLLSRFSYLSDAQNFAARNFGGPGAKCSCR